jgi:hypothetical protein
LISTDIYEALLSEDINVKTDAVEKMLHMLKNRSADELRDHLQDILPVLQRLTVEINLKGV